jgi:hypothetical protein
VKKINLFKRRTGRKAASAIDVTNAHNMLQLFGGHTNDGMLEAMLRSTSLQPRSLYSRLKQFTDYYESGLWNITSVDAFELLEIFRVAYEMIIEEDGKTGINTCKGYCVTYGIECVAIGREEFYTRFQKAVDVVAGYQNMEASKIIEM